MRRICEIVVTCRVQHVAASLVSKLVEGHAVLGDVTAAPFSLFDDNGLYTVLRFI